MKAGKRKKERKQGTERRNESREEKDGMKAEKRKKE
jgi:hypothetical protein